MNETDAEAIRAHVQKLLADAPPPTEATRTRVRALFSSSGAPVTDKAA